MKVQKLVLLAALVLLSVSWALADITVTFGMSQTTNGTKAAMEGARSIINGVRVFMRRYQEKISKERPLVINGQNVTFALKTLPDDYTLTNVTANYRALANDSTVTFLLAPFGTSGTTWAMGPAEAAGKVLMATTSASSTFNRNQRHTFSTYPPVSTRLTSMLPLLRLTRFRTAAIFRAAPTTAGIAGEVCTGLEDQLTEIGITTLGTHIVDYSASGTPTEAQFANYSRIAVNIAAQNPDITFACVFNRPNIDHIADVWKNSSWAPKVAVIATDGELTAVDAIQFWVGTDLINKNNSFKGDNIFSNWTEYINYFDSTSTLPNPLVVPYAIELFSTYACVLVMEAVRRSGSLDQEQVAEFVRRSFLNTFVGTFSYSSESVLLLPGFVYQHLNRSRVAVAPLTVQEAEFVYPIPTWAERLPHNDLWGVEIASIIILTIALLAIAVCAVFLVVYRDHPNIVAGSPLFLAAMLFGCLLIYIGLLISLPSRLTSVACVLKPWLIATGCTFLFGAIFAKTWRIWSLWSNDSVKVFRISDATVAAVLALFLVPDIAFLLAWTLAGNVEASTIIRDPYRASVNYVTCTTNSTTAPALLWTVFGWHMVVFGVGAILAWRVRRIPIKIYDESKSIAFSLYNVGFFGIILAVLLSVASTDHLVLYGILVFLAAIGSLITVAFIFGTKLNFVMSHDGSRHTTSGSLAETSKWSGTGRSQAPGSSMANGGGSTASSLEKELDRAKAKIKKMRARIAELEAEIQEQNKEESEAPESSSSS